ncbi:hypothetical protein [Nocardioides litoris]|nr:hypothetical protein [Nocardioides litoris]
MIAPEYLVAVVIWLAVLARAGMLLRASAPAPLVDRSVGPAA